MYLFKKCFIKKMTSSFQEEKKQKKIFSYFKKK